MTQGRTTPSMLATRSQAFNLARRLVQKYEGYQARYTREFGQPSILVDHNIQRYRRLVRYCLLRGVAT